MATTLNKLIVHNASWHLIDARGQIVGRLAAQIAPILRGKHKPTFCPNDDCGDYVVVVNSKHVEFTGRKWSDKIYKWHTGWPGGLRERSAEDQRNRKPEEILRRAVMGMLPKNSLRQKLTTKLLIYPGPAHPHEDKLPYETTSCILADPHVVIDTLVACHEEHPYGKFWGNCNDAKAALDKCFVEEKEERRKNNLRKAREFEEKFVEEVELRNEELRRETAQAQGGRSRTS